MAHVNMSALSDVPYSQNFKASNFQLLKTKYSKDQKLNHCIVSNFSKIPSSKTLHIENFQPAMYVYGTYIVFWMLIKILAIATVHISV